MQNGNKKDEDTASEAFRVISSSLLSLSVVSGTTYRAVNRCRFNVRRAGMRAGLQKNSRNFRFEKAIIATCGSIIRPITLASTTPYWGPKPIGVARRGAVGAPAPLGWRKKI